MDWVTIVAIGLVAGGVIGSALPMLPGALLSLAGVYLFWWHTGFTAPGPIAIAVLTMLGLTAIVMDHLAGPIAAGAGGASTRTIAAAAIVGVLLFFVTGPLGLLVGLFGTVFALEYHRQGDAGRGVRAATYAVIGVLGSTVAQVALTGTMLVVFAIIVL